MIYPSNYEHFCMFGAIGDCTVSSSSETIDITDTVTNIDNSIKNKVDQNCNSTQSANNVINIINTKMKDSSLSQQNTVKNLCVLQSALDSSISNNIQQKVLDTIKENLEAKGSVLGSPASTNSVSQRLIKSKTDIDNSKFNEVAKNCILNIQAENIANIIGSDIEHSGFNQVNDSFLQCLSEHSDITKITTDDIKETELGKDTVDKSSGGNLIESIGNAISSIIGSITGIVLSPLTGSGIVIGIIIFICCSSFISSSLGLGLSSGSSSGSAFSPTYSSPSYSVPSYSVPNYSVPNYSSPTY